METPRILIITRGVWKDSEGTSSTLTNFFKGYDRDKIAEIYIETKQPQTVCCSRFFQISEYSLIKKIFLPKTKTGFDFRNDSEFVTNEEVSNKEARTMNWVRRHRSYLFIWLRELLWSFNGWQTKELRDFIQEFNPDMIWMDGSPRILMNRLHQYVKKVSGKPSTLFLMDDVYTYPRTWNLLELLYYKKLRSLVRKNVACSDKVFVASPKMKEEYDKTFNIDSYFIAKGADFSQIQPIGTTPHKGIKLVYLGQVYCGRIYTLIRLVEILKKKNEEGVDFHLSIYTNNYIPPKELEKVQVEGVSEVLDVVPYSELGKVMEENDILLFVETFEEKYKNLARLSFSTKIVDYLASGKCIFAIGPGEIAPIRYFNDNEVAFVASKPDEIEKKIDEMITEQSRQEIASRSFEFAKKEHDINDLHNRLYKIFENITKK